MTGGEWCSVICEDEHKTVANSYEVESKWMNILGVPVVGKDVM